jgi:peptide/nickel transport system substrate-binding protein
VTTGEVHVTVRRTAAMLALGLALADTGTVSEDGRTYTFTLKDGVKFGPPLSREITSRDLDAIERIGQDGRALSQYSGYYDVIEGFAELADGKAGEISGIETPDEKTIVFHLTEPTGDFLYRLSMPAAGAIPEEGRRLLRRARALRPLPHRLRPVHDRRVREPRRHELRHAEADLGLRPEHVADARAQPRLRPVDRRLPRELPGQVRVDDQHEPDDIFNRVKEGLLDVNLTQPPFDDVHVRKAVNWVMDKEGLRRAWGGSTAGDIANHIVPDSMFDDALADYRPYGTDGDAGDVEKAKEEMRQSRYDTDKDGICDAPECKDVLHIAGTRGVDTAMQPVIEESLRKIGITLKTRANEDSYTIIQTTENNIPFSSRPGWGKDYADAYTFFYYMFYGPTIQPVGNVNYWLVGLTPDRADELGVKGNVEGVPSVDADIERCAALSGDERLDCWQALDEKLMEEVVPLVPYLDATTTDVVGPAVTKWDWDQFSGTIAYSRVAVDPSKQ